MKSSATENPDAAEPAGEGEIELRQGDCIHSISNKFGFYWETIWNHPDNAALKNARSDPSMLLAGDKIAIPEKERGEESVATEAKHRFRRLGIPVKLRLRFLEDGEPQANLNCVAQIDGRHIDCRTNGEGEVEIPIPPNAKSGWIRLGDSPVVHELDIGHLDPPDTLQGIQQRLQNLGFYEGAIDSERGPVTKGSLNGFAAVHELQLDEDDPTSLFQDICDAHKS